jgi:GNAT superfamily N-acetyltransferase
MRITLRPAVAIDAGAIGAVFDAAVKAEWHYLGDANGVVAGFTAVRPSECELFLLFVHPDSAGKGIGRLLLAAADDALRSAGCRTAIVYTHERNSRAIAVYEAAGYRRDGSQRESDFRGTAIREPRLVKQL